eukprot:3933806-Rhodomonas_salina.1
MNTGCEAALSSLLTPAHVSRSVLRYRRWLSLPRQQRCYRIRGPDAARGACRSLSGFLFGPEDSFTVQLNTEREQETDRWHLLSVGWNQTHASLFWSAPLPPPSSAAPLNRSTQPACLPCAVFN